MSASSKKELCNALEAEKLTERQLAEQKEAKKMKTYTISFVAVLAVLLVIALTVGVMNGKAMPAIEIIPKTGFYDYKNKYQAGATEEICPAPIGEEATKKVQRLAERVHEALMVDAYCRVDFLWNAADGEMYCLEANTLPGMTPTSLIPQMARELGMDYGSLCEKIIEVSLEKYR